MNSIRKKGLNMQAQRNPSCTYKLPCFHTIHTTQHGLPHVQYLFAPRNVRFCVRNLTCIPLCQSLQRFLTPILVNFLPNQTEMLWRPQNVLVFAKVSPNTSSMSTPGTRSYIFHPAHARLLRMAQTGVLSILVVHCP